MRTVPLVVAISTSLLSSVAWSVAASSLERASAEGRRSSALLRRTATSKERDMIDGLAQSFMLQIKDGAEGVVAKARNFLLHGATSSTDQAGTSTPEAEKMLVGVIQHSQVDLLNRLEAVKNDLDATDARAKFDLEIYSRNEKQSTKQNVVVNEIDQIVKSADMSSASLKKSVPAVKAFAKRIEGQIDDLTQKANKAKSDATKAKANSGAKRRVNENKQALHAMIPRLQRLDRKMWEVESTLYDGDLPKMVGDNADEETTNIMEDVSRAAGRHFPNMAR